MKNNINENEQTLTGYLKQIIFIGVLILVVIGDIISKIFPTKSFFYWIILIPVFGVCAFYLERLSVKNESTSNKQLYTILVTHWGGTGLSMMAVFYLMKLELIEPMAAGLVIHVMLGLSTFLAGIQMGWTFFALGIVILLSAGLVALDLNLVINLLFVIVPTVLFLFYLGHRFLFSPYIKVD